MPKAPRGGQCLLPRRHRLRGRRRARRGFAPSSVGLKVLLFGELFFGLRRAGLPVGLSEWMVLMASLASGAVRPDLLDFYRAARAILVKSEAHYDSYDQVFSAVFQGGRFPPPALEELLEWLRDPITPELSPERIAALEALVAWCEQGPSYARVDMVEQLWLEATGEFEGFRVSR